MDPLSIATAVIGITRVCVTVAWELKLFIDGAKLANSTVNILLHDVEAFKDTLEKLDILLKDPQTNGSIGLTGHWGSHWTHVKTSLDDAKVMICSLESKIVKINKTVKILDSARKHVRLMKAAEELERYQSQIRSFRDTIQMSLQTATLWYQTSSHEATQNIAPRLDELQAEIRRLGVMMNTQIQSMEVDTKTMLGSSTTTQVDLVVELKATQNLRECLKSAASVVSSTSTILQDQAPAGSSADSNYGDVFSSSSNEFVRDWVHANTVTEIPEFSDLSVRNREDASGQATKDAAEWDSDDEHDVELACALHQKAVLQFQDKDYQAAENSLEISLNMLAELRMASASSTIDLKLKIMTDLVAALKGQSKWSDAQKVLRDKMAIQSQQNNGPSSTNIPDTLTLTELLHAQGEYTEALLYGRMSYKAINKMGSSKQHERQKCLKLLVNICRDSGNSSMAAAYASIADGSSAKTTEESDHTTDTNVKQWTSTVALETLTGHCNWVYAVAFSPDGKILASASGDDTVRLWDSQTGAAKILRGHSAKVYGVAFSPDGKLLASASSDKTVRLWDSQTGAAKMNLSHSHWAYAVAFSPDGKTLASTSGAKVIQLWDGQTGAASKTLAGHSDSILAIAFSPNGKMLASASSDKTIRLWDCQTDATINILTGHSARAHAVAFSPDSQTLGSASIDMTIQLWDIQTGTMITTLVGHSDAVLAVAFSPNGEILASASSDKTVRLWNNKTGTVIKILTGHLDSVCAIAFSPDGNTLASGSGDHTVRLWK